ncbi:PDZ domain-containing protein, partial [bacterium]|nr:PDZ domain-containing protein [bacterium]
MKKKQILIFILLVLFLVLFDNILIKGFNSNSDKISSDDLINHRQVSPQKLFDESWSTIKSNYLESDLNKQNWERWKKHYAGKIKTDEDATVAINTMLASLDDPYSRYLNKKDYESQNTSIDSKIMGIGVNITSIKGEIVVVNTIEGTPAYKAGLQSRDIITKVNSKNVKGMPIADVATIVRG